LYRAFHKDPKEYIPSTPSFLHPRIKKSAIVALAFPQRRGGSVDIYIMHFKGIFNHAIHDL
jgi:hypothetical protein